MEREKKGKQKTGRQTEEFEEIKKKEEVRTNWRRGSKQHSRVGPEQKNLTNGKAQRRI
jgi:hypothetical protein